MRYPPDAHKPKREAEEAARKERSSILGDKGELETDDEDYDEL